MREHNTTHTLPSKLEKKNMEPIQRHRDKLTGKGKKKQTKLQKQMKTIRGTVVTKNKIIIIKKNNAT
jgi:hypothetical protein